MDNYFDIQEFIIDPDMECVPIHVVQKIDRYHKPILNRIRAQLECPVIISKHSGYRSVEWEEARGRDGSSQHTFRHKGAVDVTCRQMRFPELLNLLKLSEYRRVCLYPDEMFIHCDFDGHEKQYYECENGIWKYKGNR